ncbi:MAG: hypothetical protein K5841_07060 [Fretibacterium sp.]|nr:hypothetical protein [Fretibacterium sp.]
MANVKEVIENIREQVSHNGIDIVCDKNGKKQTWGGANLVVELRPRPKPHDGDIYVITKHAYEVSALVYALKDACRDYINFDNKFGFYPRLGEAANRFLAENGDNNLQGLLNTIIDEAQVIMTEWTHQETGNVIDFPKKQESHK